jgi:hypothetical protein
MEPFFKIHPRYKDAEEFKKVPNDIMWAVYYLYDYESPYTNQPFEERKKTVLNTVERKNIKNLEELGEQYNKLQEDSPYRTLRIMDKLLNNRAAFLDTVQYTIENAAEVDKMLKDTASIMKSYQDAKDTAMSNVKNRKKGGGQKSLMDAIEKL